MTRLWFGNVAKMRIIDRIVSVPGPKRVFDYGAGSGGDWPETLARYPEIQLYAYEPSKAVRKLRGRIPSATILDDIALHSLPIAADFIVSFSVFEHVYDRPAYLATARRHLAPSETFFLNYDDGHFRKSIDLNAPGSWVGPMREHITSLGAGVWPKIGMVGRYQKRVLPDDADRMVADAGFKVASVRYENLISLKNLAHCLPDDQRAKFAEYWLKTETDLNERFSFAGKPSLGDDNILWREMASRSLELKLVQC
jgi:hypothetical protein